MYNQRRLIIHFNERRMSRAEVRLLMVAQGASGMRLRLCRSNEAPNVAQTRTADKASGHFCKRTFFHEFQSGLHSMINTFEEVTFHPEVCERARTLRSA